MEGGLHAHCMEKAARRAKVKFLLPSGLSVTVLQKKSRQGDKNLRRTTASRIKAQPPMSRTIFSLHLAFRSSSSRTSSSWREDRSPAGPVQLGTALSWCDCKGGLLGFLTCDKHKVSHWRRYSCRVLETCCWSWTTRDDEIYEGVSI